jgi:hypothetical protein
MGSSFENFETCFLAPSIGGGVQEGADGLNGVAAFANYPWHIALARGKMKDNPLGRFSLRKDNLVRIFDELADDEEKELLHASQSAQAVAFFRALLMMLPTVSEGRAPTPTQ